MDAGGRWLGDRVRAHVVVHPGARPAVRVHVQPAAARRRRHRRLGHPRREDPRRQVIIDWHTQQTSCYMLSLSLSLSLSLCTSETFLSVCSSQNFCFLQTFEMQCDRLRAHRRWAVHGAVGKGKGDERTGLR
jgi:hypothetical protein